jgi:uncharacterized metal-binding protein
MRYGIPLLGNRIAPRCTIADRLLLVTVSRNQVRSRQVLAVEASDWTELIALLFRTQIDMLVCGGIAKAVKDEVVSSRIGVIDNVAGTSDDVLAAVVNGTLRREMGLQQDDLLESNNGLQQAAGMPQEQGNAALASMPSAGRKTKDMIDCLACRERVCLRGASCDQVIATPSGQCDCTARQIIDAAMDVALEDHRVLCRLSELIYFCLEMKYRRLGMAYCSELLEQTEVLAGVLRRFFEVIPVCCKIGGIRLNDPLLSRDAQSGGATREQIACNPLKQADALNQAGTDLNVAVGLCVGIDCLFAKHSQAPVSTLIVKDKSLAHNPIGALYSEYYLKEATRTRLPLAGATQHT